MKKKPFYFVLLLTLLVSCNIWRIKDPEFAKNSTNENQPVENMYQIKKEKFDFNSIIDTNCIYVAELELDEPDKNLFSFFRFSNKGVCFTSNNYERNITFFDYNFLKFGQYGRYKIDKKNKLTVEFYHPGYHTFLYWYGKVSDDRILFSRQKYVSKFGGTNIEEYIYYKQKAKITEGLKFPK